MKGDITRDTFNPAKHFSQVLMQQGRVQLDADWNEQGAILLHYIRTVVADLLGPYAAPAEGGGFKLTAGSGKTTDFGVSRGRIYVDGILVENDSDTVTYLHQPDYDDPPQLEQALSYLAYLDVWEDHITPLEDPEIHEPALGRAETTTRSQVVWQVKAERQEQLSEADKKRLNEEINATEQKIKAAMDELNKTQDPRRQQALKDQIQGLEEHDKKVKQQLGEGTPDQACDIRDRLPALSDARLIARLDPSETSKDPCIQKPDSKYRGATNQLYRIEIHYGTPARGSGGKGPTFKWSRDNGSVATALLEVQGNQLIVDSARGFEPNEWVELSNDDLRLKNMPGSLVKLINVQGDTLTFDPSTDSGSLDLAKAKYVRRWDQKEVGDIKLLDGAIPVNEGHWIPLEDGIQVQFVKGGTYRSGDYWQIPARVITGALDLPMAPNGKQSIELPPRGIVHHYAPLGVFILDKNNALQVDPTCRCEFQPLDCTIPAPAPQPAPKPAPPDK